MNTFDASKLKSFHAKFKGLKIIFDGRKGKVTSSLNNLKIFFFPIFLLILLLKVDNVNFQFDFPRKKWNQYILSNFISFY